MTILPNIRWLCLPSEAQGEDWIEKSREIDEALADAGMDLAEESVYLLFDRSPGSVLNQESQCKIARSVIGPKRDFIPPFKLIDWTSAPVHRKILQARNWQDAFEEAYSEWEILQREMKVLSKHFMLCLHRRLVPELELEIEVIFSE